MTEEPGELLKPLKKIQNPEIYQSENLQCAKQWVYVQKKYVEKLLYWEVQLNIEDTDTENLR